MGTDLDNFIKSLENFKNNYVIDPSNVMGPMVEQLKQRVEEFKKFHEDRSNDNIQLPEEKTPTTRDNRWIEVDPFPGPFSPPLPWSPSQRSKFRDASASLSDSLPEVTNSQPDNSTPVAYPRLSTRVVNTDLAQTIFETKRRIPCKLPCSLESKAANPCDNGSFARRSWVRGSSYRVT